MGIKTFLALSAGTLVLGGITVGIDQTSDTRGVPFIAPESVARSLCGKNPQAIADRRAFFVRAAQAYAEEQASANGAVALPPAHPSYRYQISTKNDEAQRWFDTGLAHMFNFNHEEAIKAFRMAQAADSDCAMCYWAEAYALGPNINAGMAAEAVSPALAAMEKAAALSATASPREADLIAALQTRYTDPAPENRSALDLAFAEAMDEAARAWPDDDFIAAVAAEANMDTQRWDYWLAGGREPKGRTEKTLSLLETVLARTPDHGPAIHLYIHLTEASSDPYRALSPADRLAGLSDGLGHLIHMPSHTYYRVGKYRESLSRNVDAVAADEFYLAGADAGILYEYGYFTHNIHFALTSAQMGGDAKTALAMADKLDEKLPADMVSAAPWVEPIKAAPWYARAQFMAPADILAMPAPPPELSLLNAAWHYARGSAHLDLGNLEAARAEASEISVILGESELSAEIPSGTMMEIARLVLTARAAAAEQDYITALEAAEAAVSLQDSLPYTEPPYWYYPTRQTLAAIALQAGQTERAEQLFIETLAQSPNNAWVLAGLADVYEARGDGDARRYAEGMFRKAWLGEKRARPSLDRL